MPPRRPPPGFHARRAANRRQTQAPAPPDASDAQPADSVPAPAPQPQSHPVGKVADYILRKLKADPRLSNLWLEGEVRSYSKSGAGHIYFDLADDQGALACVFFRQRNRGVQFEQGDQVLVHGAVDMYRPRGALQIIVDAVQPIGAGVLEAEFQRLYRQLDLEGLFATERKRSLPVWPRRIGVVTSASGAVWHDIQNVVRRRWPLTTLILSPCLTQGAGAADSIADAIADLNHTDPTPDLIIVARGGGSPEDLWAYNEEPVARAIFASAAPVVSAVGHQTDVTIADHVADLRAPTPSAAAEIAVPNRTDESARIAAATAALSDLLERRLSEGRQHLDQAAERFDRALPDLDALRSDLDAALQQLDRAAQRQTADRTALLAALQGRLTALDPAATLTRGYTIVTDPNGRPLSSARQIALQDSLHIQFHDGIVQAHATAVQTESSAP